MTSKLDSGVASSLIQEIASINALSQSIVQDEASRVQALNLARKLVNVLEKPEDAALQNAMSSSEIVVARIAVDLNLYDLIADGSGEAKKVGQLAVVTNADPRLLTRILRLLDCMGWVKQLDDDSFAPTPITEAMKGKALQACLKHHFDIGFRVFEKLPEYFRKFGFQQPSDENNGPFQYAFNVDQPAFQWWQQDPELSENFNTFMTGVRGARPHWVRWFPIRERILNGASQDEKDVLLVDIAGGRGHDLHRFIEAFSDVKGRFVLEDLPVVINDYRSANARIEPLKHDILTPQPIHDARVYFLHHVLHDWSDDASIQILSQVAKAMKPNYSRVILGENVLPSRECPINKARLDWAMMALHCGMARTVSQFDILCEKAGLKLVKYWPPPGDGDGIIEAVLQGDDLSLLNDSEP
jgi:hypothetical protein